VSPPSPSLSIGVTAVSDSCAFPVGEGQLLGVGLCREGGELYNKNKRQGDCFAFAKF